MERRGNIFFIQSPLQLLIAQLIINQEKLVDNIMIYGYIHANTHSLDAYEVMRIPEMWQECIFIEKIAEWGLGSFRSLHDDLRIFRKNYKKISDAIQKHNVTTLYLGDLGNNTYHMIDYLFANKGLDICFFEEGNGHYLLPIKFSVTNYSWKMKLAKMLYGIFYYKPFYNIDGRYFLDDRTIEHLTITRRYSVIPYFKESFDVLIKPNFEIKSKTLENYIRKELGCENNSGSVLLLTTVWDNTFGENTIELYYAVIEDYIKSLSKDTVIYIKPHPRETEDTKKTIEQIVKTNDMRYKYLGVEFNVPIEYYLQDDFFAEVCVFFSSVAFYNGYLYKRKKIVYLIDKYYQLCKSNKIGNLDLIDKCIKSRQLLQNLTN